MGYRNYIASITRAEYNKIKNFTKEELFKYKNKPIDKIEYVSVRDVDYNKLYELGKYVDSFPKRLFKPVFTNKELQNYFTEEQDFYLVGKKFLEAVIKRYSEDIRNYYNKMLEPLLTDEKFPKLKDPNEYDPKHVYKLAEHVKSMAFEWGCSPYFSEFPYNLEKGDSITTSWKYEYTLFELVRIYKHFDWKNNVMIYYGY